MQSIVADRPSHSLSSIASASGPKEDAMCASEKTNGWFDSRSKAAHGSGEAGLAPVRENYAIAQTCSFEMIESRGMLIGKELEAHLGDAVGLPDSA